MIWYHSDPSPISAFCQRLLRKWSIAESQSTVSQSAYRPFHSTKTAVVSIHNNMISVANQGHIGALVLLDLSGAFDTVDYSILTDGSALSWVVEFLNNRRQVVQAGKTESDNIAPQFAVPQGSVLGPRVFIQYAGRSGHFPVTWRHHDTICLLTTCKVTATDDLTSFLQLSLSLRAASLTSASGCCQAFTAQCWQDRTDVVQFCILAASAGTTDQYHPRQLVRCQATDRRQRPGHVIRRRAVDALACLTRESECFYHLC